MESAQVPEGKARGVAGGRQRGTGVPLSFGAVVGGGGVVCLLFAWAVVGGEGGGGNTDTKVPIHLIAYVSLYYHVSCLHFMFYVFPYSFVSQDAVCFMKKFNPVFYIAYQYFVTRQCLLLTLTQG